MHRKKSMTPWPRKLPTQRRPKKVRPATYHKSRSGVRVLPRLSSREGQRVCRLGCGLEDVGTQRREIQEREASDHRLHSGAAAVDAAADGDEGERRSGAGSGESDASATSRKSETATGDYRVDTKVKQAEFVLRRRHGIETPLGRYYVKRVGMHWRVYHGVVCIWETWAGAEDAQQRANEYLVECENRNAPNR